MARAGVNDCPPRAGLLLLLLTDAGDDDDDDITLAMSPEFLIF